MKTQNGVKWPKPKKLIKLPLYGRRSLALYTNQKAYTQAIKNRNDEKVDLTDVGGRVTMCPDDDGYMLYVVGWFAGSVGSLVHELMHVGFFVFESAGLDPKDSDGEALCYYVQYLVDELLD